MGSLDQSTGIPVAICAIRHTQASSARAARFFAAFRSRSISVPQASQRKTRADRDSRSFLAQQHEQVLEDGNHLEASHRKPPYQWQAPATWVASELKQAGLAARCWRSIMRW